MSEHIVCSNSMAKLDDHQLLSDRQHDFRKIHSCETPLTAVTNDRAKRFDNKVQVDAFTLDSEALDTTLYESIERNSFGYEIGGKTLKLGILFHVVYVAFMHVCLLMPCGHLLGKG